MERQFDLLQTTCDLIRQDRGKFKLNMRRPLQEVVIYSNNQRKLDDLQKVSYYIKDEMKIFDISFQLKPDLVKNEYLFNYSTYGRELGRYAKKIMKHFMELNGINETTQAIPKTLKTFENFEYSGTLIEIGKHITVKNKLNDKYDFTYKNGIAIDINTEETELVKNIYKRNLVSNHIQQFRKEMGLHMWNEIQVYFRTHQPEVMTFLKATINDYDTILTNNPIIESDFDNIKIHIRSGRTKMELNGKELEILVDLIKD